jgi:hypothetical protein
MSRYGYAGPKPHRSVWAVLGIVAAVVLCVFGLVIVGAIVLLYVGLSHTGSNK